MATSPNVIQEINPHARQHREYRESVRGLCRDFGSEYWQRVEAEDRYPHEFVQALTDAGWLSVLIPAEYGGGEANMAKMLAADASWEAANVCLQTHGGFGFATEYDVERKFRETRLYQVAPVSTNLILSYIGEHILGMPRSF